MKQYKINVKKLKLMNRKRQQQFEIETKFRIMKLSLGGLNKYRMEYNKIKKVIDIVLKLCYITKYKINCITKNERKNTMKNNTIKPTIKANQVYIRVYDNQKHSLEY